MSLAEKLYELRKSKNLTQDDMAEAIGVSRQAVSKWEMGTGTPSLENLKALSTYFGVSIDSLINGTESEIPADPQKETDAANKNQKRQISKNQIIFSDTLAVVVLGLILVITKTDALTTLLNLSNSAMPFKNILKTILFAIAGFAYIYSLVCVFDKNIWVLSFISDGSGENRVKTHTVAKIAVLLIYMFVSPTIFSLLISLTDYGLSYIGIVIDTVSKLIDCAAVYVIMTWGGKNIFKNKKLRVPITVIFAIVAVAVILLNVIAIRGIMQSMAGENILSYTEVLFYTEMAATVSSAFKVAIMGALTGLHAAIE